MLQCLTGPPEVLYVVLPYFNFCGFRRRRELFVQFVKRIRHPNVRIVVSECLGPAPLPRLKGVWAHWVFKTDSNIWLKESLINMAVRRMPRDWKYVAWIDADITFMNEQWVHDTFVGLQTHNILQLFQTAINIGPKGESMKLDKSFVYMYRDSGTTLVKNDRYGFWHPGYAWACRRQTWDAMGGLLDWAILGSADRHMAYAWIGRVLDSAPGNVHANYRAMLREFQAACKSFSLGYVHGTILHHWHGSLENRRYRERWNILSGHQFDPLSDIGECSSSGIIQLTPTGRRMDRDLLDYFVGRKEDN